MTDAELTRRLAAATDADTAYQTLYHFADARFGARLFTVMTVDMGQGLARRAWSSDPVAYPVSGTKPITFDAWFDVVHRQHRTFVANTLDDIAKVFPDHALIGALGCGSVVNLPVLLRGELAATINLLDVAGHYTPDLVAAIERDLTLPAMVALLLAAAG